MNKRFNTANLFSALMLAGLFALGLVSIHVPFGRDQGVAAYIAEVMVRGGVVYKDVFHFNLPGIFFTYRAALLTGLGWPEAANFIHLVFLAFTYIAVLLAGRKFLSPWGAALAAFFYGSFAVTKYTDYWDMAQKESLACLPLSLALIFYLGLVPPGDSDERESPRISGLFLSSLLAGLFTGLAAQYKPTLGVVLLTGLYALWLYRKNKKAAAMVAVGLILGLLASFAPLFYYLFVHDAGSYMYDSIFRYGGFYGGQEYKGLAMVGAVIRELLQWIYHWRFLTIPAFIGMVFIRDLSPRLKTVIVFGILLLMQVVLQMKFFSYHWIPMLLPAALLAGQAVEFLLGKTAAEKDADPAGPGYLRWAIGLLLLALFFGNLWPSVRRYHREMLYNQGRISEINFLIPYGGWRKGDICPLAMKEVANYLRANTRPSDPVLVFGHELGLYVMAERFAPNRFPYDQPVATKPQGLSSGMYIYYLREEYIRSFDQNPPAYVVVIENDRSAVEPEDSFTQLQSFRDLKERIDRDYALETIIEDYHIYRRLEKNPDGRKR